MERWSVAAGAGRATLVTQDDKKFVVAGCQ